MACPRRCRCSGCRPRHRAGPAACGTADVFGGAASGLISAWSRTISTRSGIPASSRLARSMPSTISAPEAPPCTCDVAESVHVRVVPIYARWLIRRNLEAILKRRVARRDHGLEHVVLVTNGRHRQAVKMQFVDQPAISPPRTDRYGMAHGHRHVHGS